MQDLKLWLGIWGEKFGIVLVFAPTLYDFIGTGLRGFFEWKILPFGIVMMLIGGVLIYISKRIDKELR